MQLARAHQELQPRSMPLTRRHEKRRTGSHPLVGIAARWPTGQVRPLLGVDYHPALDLVGRPQLAQGRSVRSPYE
jgi:hypothetical protein